MDAALAEIMDAWNCLPEATRAAMIAMLRTAMKQVGSEWRQDLGFVAKTLSFSR
jgi:hypothetical protein